MANDPSPTSPESWADSKTGLVLQPGALINGKYRLLRPAGFGGMGAVWVARNEATNADVALKVLLAGPGGASGASGASGEANLRFRREAHAAAQLYHRGIVRIFDLVELTGDDQGTLVMVMELLRGETLAHRIDIQRTFSLEETLALILPLLSALSHAHHAGIVHRDLKPENVFLAIDPDGHIIPKILDFGISKLSTQEAPKITTDGAMLGTPSYMSPEQARGSASVDARSDVFAMGILLYEMLSGQSPFASGSYHSVIAAILERDPPPLTMVPPNLWRVIRRALDKVAEIRFADAAELAAALKQAASSVGIAAPDVSDAYPVRTASMADRSVPPAPYREPQLTVPSVHVGQRRRARNLITLAAATVAVTVTAFGLARRAGTPHADRGRSTSSVSSPAPPEAPLRAVAGTPSLPVIPVEQLPVASPATRAALSPAPSAPSPAAHARASAPHARAAPAAAPVASSPLAAAVPVAPPPAAPPTPAPRPSSVVRDPGF